jgi:RarD protein
MDRKRSSLWGLAISMTLFGTIGLFVKYIPLSSSLIALSRALIGFLFLAAMMLVQKKKLIISVIRKNILPLTLSGVFLGFNWILLFESYRYTSVAVSTLCYYLAPLLVVLLSPLVLKEKLTQRKILCVAASLVGMVFISGILQANTFTAKDFAGILLGLAAAVLYAAIMILNKKISGLSGYERTVFQLGLSAMVLIPYCLFTCNFVSVDLNAVQIVLLVIVGVIHNGLTYFLYFGAMDHLSSQTVAMLSYIDPVIAVLISVFILAEPMKLLDIPGAVLILGAAIVSELPERKKADK